jgi:peptidase E
MIAERGPNPLLQAVMRSTGVTYPRVAYLGVASGDAASFRVMIGRLLKKAGAGEVTLAPLCGRKANPAEAREVLSSAHLVFVSGGDVEAGMDVLHEADLVGFVRGLAQAGKPFLGVSAGSIMMGREWVRWSNPDDESTAERFPCLGVVDLCCDTHAEEDGWEELRALMRLQPERSTGYGIASSSALVVEPDGSLRALGGDVHRFERRGSDVIQVASLTPPGAAD